MNEIKFNLDFDLDQLLDLEHIIAKRKDYCRNEIESYNPELSNYWKDQESRAIELLKMVYNKLNNREV